MYIVIRQCEKGIIYINFICVDTKQNDSLKAKNCDKVQEKCPICQNVLCNVKQILETGYWHICSQNKIINANKSVLRSSSTWKVKWYITYFIANIVICETSPKI